MPLGQDEAIPLGITRFFGIDVQVVKVETNKDLDLAEDAPEVTALSTKNKLKDLFSEVKREATKRRGVEARLADQGAATKASSWTQHQALHTSSAPSPVRGKLSPMFERGTRELFRRELLPAPVLWGMAIDGMRGWNTMIARGLEAPLGGKESARETIARLVGPVFHRRYTLLRARYPHLPDARNEPSAVGLLMGALYRMHRGSPGAWILEGTGGAPRTLQERLTAAKWSAPLSWNTRWEELTTHLGEQLIALTQQLPREGVKSANALLGKVCFEGGVRYAEKAQRAFRLPSSPESAVEVLRMSEYVFRVNPHHWHRTDDTEGYLEGTACPWYAAPGWSMMHCGVFGQFQSGISSVFGLRYQLTQTIPKHGGNTCRIDLKPIALRASRDGRTL